MISLLTNSPWSIFVINILDIAIIAFAVYKILEIMRGTRAMPLAKGVGVLLVFSVLSDVLGLSTVNWVLVQLQTMFIVAIPVVFAPELRRALEQLGTGGIFARSRHLSDNDLVAHQVQQICGCMTAASASRTGVLIAVTRENGLKEYIDTGIAIDGILSTSLLRNIFIVNTPLHDGAALIEGDRIVAAKCILPVTQSDVPKSFGTRHRAAIGMSEISDAIIVVVSEETGDISIAQGGEIRLNIDPVRLQQTLQRYLTINTRKRSKKEVAE